MPEIITKKIAKELGLKRYFSGKPCPRGHIDDRYPSGGCVVCTAISAKARRLRDPEHYKKVQRDWNKRNRKKRSESKRKWNLKNPTYQAEYRKANYDRLRLVETAWRAKNHEKRLVYGRLWRAKMSAIVQALREMENIECTPVNPDKAPPQSHGERNATPLSFWSI